MTNDVTMKNQSFKDYKFFVDQSGSYQYFRFEVFANQGANVMQLCELRLIGTEAPDPQPTGVENVQSDKVQATKFFRDGQLLIEKNGKFYNAQGVEVK